MEKLYILPFDHRASFAKLFNLDDRKVTPQETDLLSDYKHIVYEGALLSLKMGVSKDNLAILADEQFGLKVHEDAAKEGIKRILTVEKSGQDEFDFEYGADYKKHIEAVKPDYIKVLVRYNPAGDPLLNERQAQRLKQMSDYCKESGYKFLFELLVPATNEQKEECATNGQDYENTLRYLGMIGAIRELQRAGVEPNIWKIEGLSDSEQMKMVIEATKAGGRDDVGTVVLGRGESDEKVKVWLSVAAKIPGVVGFAVGRTIWKQPLMDHIAKKISREEAAQVIAKNFKGYADLFEASSR